MKTIAIWSAAGLFGGSSLLLVVMYVWDEWQWRQIERRARRR